MASLSQVERAKLSAQARKQFWQIVDRRIDGIDVAVDHQVSDFLIKNKLSKAVHLSNFLDASSSLKHVGPEWAGSIHKHWLENPIATARASHSTSSPLGDDMQFSLVDDNVVENSIVAARMGRVAIESNETEWDNLWQRIRTLDGTNELVKDDLLRPEVFMQCMLLAWTDHQLTRPMWGILQKQLQTTANNILIPAWQQTNAFLDAQGVSAKHSLLRSSDGSRTNSKPAPLESEPAPLASTSPGQFGPDEPHPGAVRQPGQPQAPVGGHPSAFDEPGQPHPRSVRTGSGQTSVGAMHWRPPHQLNARDAAIYADAYPTHTASISPANLSRPMSHGTPFAAPTGALSSVDAETRMVTGLSPMMRSRQDGHNALAQLRQAVNQQIPGFSLGGPRGAPSPGLAAALAAPEPEFAATEIIEHIAHGSDAGVAAVQSVARGLRERADQLKETAKKPDEKAIIEVVALMFQAILSQERLPAQIRLWFARLQTPVLRLALTEAEFFKSSEHPTRQLIDRMGSVAMGFDAVQISIERLEPEIKRIVQVIEQYPETGQRVYRLMLKEFEQFLGPSLLDGNEMTDASTLAQKIEEKESLTVHYAIELQRITAHLAIHPAVQAFLSDVWTEVLAVATVRHGPHSQTTLQLKQTAANLVWLVSLKTTRAERSKVVQRLAPTLKVVRQGMDMLNLSQDEQSEHVRAINVAVSQAFNGQAQEIDAKQLAQLTQSLTALEDIITQEPEGDLWLDRGVVEMMGGEVGASIEIIDDGGSPPERAIIEWARQLDLGMPFELDWRDTLIQVQYVWRSARAQLHLFCASAQTMYLIQSRRLAAYLQAGLIMPIENEPLTVRATREALDQLKVNVERLQ